ncbi:MAG: DUF262 domain-containing protein [Planctomycetes bacterium]|nr:DUF262 domain-containing protein [Planctomycetota bacterium]
MVSDAGEAAGNLSTSATNGAEFDEDLDDGGVTEVEESLPFKYAITSYGADYPVDGLVERVKRGDVFIPPFQRKFIWPLPKASRFVESLLLGLPVPGIFLSREKETGKLLVIDGQQRLLTLRDFYDGVFTPSSRRFALADIASRFADRTYKTLPDDDRRRLDDSIIHATVVRQDEPSEDDSSIYMIFERLNTGGMPLSAQEIRACIYHGSFNKLLKHLNENVQWREIFGKQHKRTRDRELILRFLALNFDSDAYAPPMKAFLNLFMAKDRNLSSEGWSRYEKTFVGTIDLVHKSIGPKAFRPVRVLNAAVFDAVMVGFARRLHSGPVVDIVKLRQAYNNLLHDDDFESVIETSTTTAVNVRERVKLATEAFKDVP